MTPAEKYGRVQDMPPAAQTQAQDIGETLRSKGVSMDAGAASTPAVKYGTPNNNYQERSLSQRRSL